MTKESYGFRSVVSLNLVHFLCNVVECFIPGNFNPLFFAAFVFTNQRTSQPIRIVMGAYSASTARTKSSVAKRVFRVTFNLPKPSVLYISYCTTFPKTHTAISRNLLNTLNIFFVDFICTFEHRVYCACGGNCTHAESRDL